MHGVPECLQMNFRGRMPAQGRSDLFRREARRTQTNGENRSRERDADGAADSRRRHGHARSRAYFIAWHGAQDGALIGRVEQRPTQSDQNLRQDHLENGRSQRQGTDQELGHDDDGGASAA